MVAENENGQYRTQEKELSSKQQRAIRWLLESPTIQGAAAKAKVSRSQLYVWMEAPEFKAALSKAEKQKMAAVTARLADESALAVETLARIHKDAGQPGSVRVRAAKYVLDSMLRIQDQAEILERIEKLESMIKA